MRTTSLSAAFFLILAVGSFAGCDDSGTNSDGVPARGDSGADIVETDTAEDAEAPDSDTSPESDTDEDVQLDADACSLGDRECVDDRFRRVCNAEGAWQIQPCDEGFACERGNCVEVEAGPCTEGDTTCEAGQPAVCVSGEWVVTGACDEGLSCVGGACLTERCASEARSGSYLGCEYLATPLPNLAWGFGGTPDSPLGIVLTNSRDDGPASVWIYQADGETPADLVGEVEIGLGPTGGVERPVTVQSEILDRRREQVNAGFTRAEGIEIPPGGVGIFLVPHMGNPGETSVRPMSYWVRTDEPVAAYQFGPYCCNYSFTNDASLLLPTSAFGTDHYYLGVPSWGSPPDGTGGTGSRIPNTITVLGTRPGTDVLIELPDGATVDPGTSAAIRLTGSELSATIGPGDVLNVYGGLPDVNRSPIRGVDLSGARIRSSAPVGVFSGHECTFYPWDRGACDHLEEQLLPIDTWGREFLLTPPRFRSADLSRTTETLYWKVIAAEDDTVIELGAAWSTLEVSTPGFAGVPYCGDFLDGEARIVLDAGQHCEFGARRAFSVAASKPVMVLGVIAASDTVGFGATQAGDPAIFAVPPRRQFRNEYAFIAPTTYALDYVTIVAEPGTVVILDGQAVDMGRAASIAGSGYVFVDVPIDDGAHRVVGESPLGIIVYAYDDWVSYAFTGGLNLVKE